ncbi:DUF4358 domain-containing protein [Caproiciproducens galactitolivorans]|uniref:DUF4358 domain-containing protein n=1 Tax=Caproiciproducens galactitolivorans TaxID=642589 RepID=UPI00143836C7|nr:DUF4358 domain-containing protein [Caproiciproducens galactitolivorans]
MNKIVMDRKKWMIFSVLVLAVAIAVFVSVFIVFKNRKENAKGPAPSRITESIISEMHYTDLVEVSPNQLYRHYSIPDGVISDSSLYMSKSSDSAAELACFLLQDKSKFEELKDAVTDHINSKAAGFKGLNPTQYNFLKNYVIVQKGRYVLVSVGSNASADGKFFNDLFK